MRARLFGSRRRKVASLAVICLLAFGGVALAAWLVSGTQHYKVAGGSLSPPIFTGTTVGNTGALPSASPTGSLDATVSNPNNVPLHVTALAASPTVTFTLSTGGPCPDTNWSVQQSAVTAFFNPGASGFTVPANATNTPVHIPLSVILDVNAPTTCQGAVAAADWNGGSITWGT